MTFGLKAKSLTVSAPERKNLKKKERKKERKRE
jgi:hypothetical protein